MTRRPAILLLTFFVFVLAIQSRFCSLSSAQSGHARERLRGVLSKAKLSPEIRANASIQYSPDGKYLIVQDSAGIMLLSRDPLRFVAYIDASHAYPARFSADSQTLILVTFDLYFTRWRVADGTQIKSADLVIPGGCLHAVLSPAGDLLACYTPEMDLAIYRLDEARKLFSASVHDFPKGAVYFPIPFDSTTNFSAPFGFFLSNNIMQFANRGLVHEPTWFSPDGKFLIAGDDRDAIRVNLTTLAKENFASPIRKRVQTIAGLAQNDRALLLDPFKSEAPSVVTFSTGQTLTNFSVPADSAHLCSNPRFAIFRKESDSSIYLADLNSGTTVPILDGIAADVSGTEIAVLKRDAMLLFFKYGESKPLTVARLPLGTLPPLYASGVDSKLTTLSLSVAGTGEIFDVASGKSLLEQKAFVGTQVANPKQPLVLTPRRFKFPHQVLRDDLEAHSAEPSWTARPGPDVEIRPGEAAFLEYSFSDEFGRLLLIARDGSGVAFKLRGLDPASGTQLWHAKYNEEVPIPFCDPQGTRFVLGWKAKTSGARNAIKNNPIILEAFKHSKRMDQDSVFEVFDSITGKSLGGVFVQFGDGPINFSSAFSVGDFLFLVKDNARVFVLSLRDGKLLVQAKGLQPVANGQSGFFVLDEGFGRLGVYDLRTGTKLEQQQFPDGLAYKHFSADGKRLLVLTQHQVIYVLDMSDVREHPLPPLHEKPNSSDDSVDHPQ